MNTYQENTEAKIKIMQAYLDGSVIEARNLLSLTWFIVSNPSWDWASFSFRVAKKPDTVDRTHISSEYRYMARNRNNAVYVHTMEPRLEGKRWTSMHSARVTTPSFVRGTTDWNESVVEL